jgi:hypothetical protein
VPGHLHDRLSPVRSRCQRVLSGLVPKIRYRRAHAIIVFAFLTLIWSSEIGIATLAHGVHRILTIHETGPSALTFRLIDPQLRAALDEKSPYLVEPYGKFMETGLFPDKTFRLRRGDERQGKLSAAYTNAKLCLVRWDTQAPTR